MTYDTFWTRRYRLRLRLWRALRPRDVLGLLLLILAVLLSAQGKDLKVTGPILVLYVVFAVLRALLTLKTRESRYALQGMVVGGLFKFINSECFARSNRTRFTLFREAPFRRTHIIPWYRFRRGGIDPVHEADKSRARYAPGHGVTGRVWADPGKDLDIQLIPDFSKWDLQNPKRLMRAYYATQFNVPLETGLALSDYMVDVRCIISYAYLDQRDLFLGLLSLDIRDAEVIPPKGRSGEAHKDKIIIVQKGDEPIIVDADTLYLLTSALGNVVESFHLTEREVTYE